MPPLGRRTIKNLVAVQGLYSGGSGISHRGHQSRVGGGGGAGGRWLPKWLRFENFVCRNERIWTLSGERAAGMSPRSANALCHSMSQSCITFCLPFLSRGAKFGIIAWSLFSTIALADQKGGGGVHPARVPHRVPILSVRHTNFSKRSMLGVGAPLQVWPPFYGKSWIHHWIEVYKI